MNASDVGQKCIFLLVAIVKAEVGFMQKRRGGVCFHGGIENEPLGDLIRGCQRGCGNLIHYLKAGYT